MLTRHSIQASGTMADATDDYVMELLKTAKRRDLQLISEYSKEIVVNNAVTGVTAVDNGSIDSDS